MLIRRITFHLLYVVCECIWMLLLYVLHQIPFFPLSLPAKFTAVWDLISMSKFVNFQSRYLCK
jgi:hypothetical protein